MRRDEVGQVYGTHTGRERAKARTDYFPLSRGSSVAMHCEYMADSAAILSWSFDWSFCRSFIVSCTSATWAALHSAGLTNALCTLHSVRGAYFWRDSEGLPFSQSNQVTLSGGHIRYQPTSANAAACRGFILPSLEARIVGWEATCASFTNESFSFLPHLRPLR